MTIPLLDEEKRFLYFGTRSFLFWEKIEESSDRRTVRPVEMRPRFSLDLIKEKCGTCVLDLAVIKNQFSKSAADYQIKKFSFTFTTESSRIHWITKIKFLSSRPVSKQCVASSCRARYIIPMVPSDVNCNWRTKTLFFFLNSAYIVINIHTIFLK